MGYSQHSGGPKQRFGPLTLLIAWNFVTNGRILSASGLGGELKGCFLGQMPGFGGTISITIA